MIKLSAIIDLPEGAIDPDVRGIAEDSRQVKKGYVFAALSGLRHNGALFAEDAVRAGAVAILVGEDEDLPAFGGDVVVLKVKEPRHVLSMMAARFYALQPDHIAAITGTNGKTSTADFLRQIWNMTEHKAVSLGTLGIRADKTVKFNSPLARMSMTTPDPVSLHAGLADLKAAGFEYVAMEASSHGLDQYRLDGVKVRAAGFSNLSHDHLDYHGDMQEYLAAKMHLFTDILAQDGTAVLNADIEEFAELEEACRAAGRAVISYGKSGTDIHIISCTPAPEGQKLCLEIAGQQYDVTLPLVGYFQVMNALCALALACSIASEQAGELANIVQYLDVLTRLQGVPGRLQYIEGHESAAVYVDYAHTPDALNNILDALRPHTEGQLYCIIGCGGDRDKTKRPVMAKIAQDKADIAVITDDNPRSEDPTQIRKDMMVGAPEAKEIGGRAEAIKWAVAQLEKGDVLVIAGKGHEQGQIIGDITEPFDDREQARAAIALLQNSTTENSKEAQS